MTDSLVTIVGSSYFEPISTLLEELEKYDKGNSNQVQSGYYVNGFASSICLLAVVCLESYVMRVRYINKASQNQIDRTPVAIYLMSLYSDFPYEKEVIEVHILRDVIAHNHLWEISYTWDDEESMKYGGANKRSSGDPKYQQRVDSVNNITTTLGLNVSPIKVGSDDVKKVLQTVWKVLLFLEEKNRNQCYVSHLTATHKGELVKFGKIIGMEEICT